MMYKMAGVLTSDHCYTYKCSPNLLTYGLLRELLSFIQSTLAWQCYCLKETKDKEKLFRELKLNLSFATKRIVNSSFLYDINTSKEKKNCNLAWVKYTRNFIWL